WITPLCIIITLILIFAFIFLAAIFMHISHVLRKRTHHSTETMKRTRRSVFNLFVQISVLYVFIIVPG
ncbi:hypothetical protein PMAYCL1PPCAC_14858, partial [Pristionchus mayeri]